MNGSSVTPFSRGIQLTHVSIFDMVSYNMSMYISEPNNSAKTVWVHVYFAEHASTRHTVAQFA
jgi:hypothetical protein